MITMFIGSCQVILEAFRWALDSFNGPDNCISLTGCHLSYALETEA